MISVEASLKKNPNQTKPRLVPSNLQGWENEYDWSWDLKKQICVSINIVIRTSERCQTEKPAAMFLAASTPKIKPRRACWKNVREICRALQIDKVFIFRNVSFRWTTSNNQESYTERAYSKISCLYLQQYNTTNAASTSTACDHFMVSVLSGLKSV